MLNVNNINRTKRPLQITVCTLNKLLREAYETKMILEDKKIDFDLWCTEKKWWQANLQVLANGYKIILLYLAMMKPIRDGEFEDFKSSLSAIMPLSFL